MIASDCLPIHFIRAVPKHLLGATIKDCDESACVGGNNRYLCYRIEHGLKLLFCASEFGVPFRHTSLQFVSCALLVINVRRCAHPLDDLVFFISQGQGTSEVPPVSTVQILLGGGSPYLKLCPA
jgi:hypothetical protein